MRRELGSWLEGPGLPRDGTPGERLGLPAAGPGSIASFGARIGAFFVDAVVANLLAGVPALFGVAYSSNVRGLVVCGAFLLVEFVMVSVTGQTIGKQLFRIRVVRVRDRGRQGWPWIAVRTLLLALVIPFFMVDRDHRGLHDRACGTALVRV
ncbi:MAG: RDD family protein [Frankia sp.]|nr:RDD family protein [Frankia sp.]